jgi:acyl-CoA hydrolase
MSHDTDRAEITFRFLAAPGDVNYGGKVHGGAVLKWIDQVGYACATAWSGTYCVTAYVGGISFVRPVAIGHLVETTARIAMTGRSSMHIKVDVRSADPKLRDFALTTTCMMVFVAVDEHGKSVPVTAWSPLSESDRQLEALARAHADDAKRHMSDMHTQLVGLSAG